MVGVRGAVIVVVGLCFGAGEATAQGFVADLAGAWGREERTVDMGLGMRYWHLNALVGLAAVEHGLKPGLEWTPDKTRIFDTNGNQIDPRDGRTAPWARRWARLELQPAWWGGAVMWDPRNAWALGAFGEINLAGSSYGIGELRWLDGHGFLLAARLRFR